MLGYVRPDKNELKLKEIRVYQSYYCSLCHKLGKEFGFIYRMILSNDMTFLLICMDSLLDEKENVTSRCPGNPFRKTTAHINCEALRYAAYLNYYLCCRKLMDTAFDTRNTVKKYIALLLYRVMNTKKRYSRWKEEKANWLNKIDSKFSELQNMEEKGACTFDELTNQFGSIVSDFVLGFEGLPLESQEKLQEICFQLGKWIYIADALDDWKKDCKKGSFNLLNTLVPKSDRTEENNYKICTVLLMMIHQKMRNPFQQISWKTSEGIIENILFFGTVNVFSRIKTKKQRGKKHE